MVASLLNICSGNVQDEGGFSIYRLPVNIDNSFEQFLGCTKEVGGLQVSGFLYKYTRHVCKIV